MNDSTKKLITRLKRLMKDNGEKIKAKKRLIATPFEQRSENPFLYPDLNDLKKVATALCMARSAMRGRTHIKGVNQIEWLNERLAMAERREAALGAPDILLPPWLRETIRAALKTGVADKVRMEKREERYARFLAKRTSAA